MKAELACEGRTRPSEGPNRSSEGLNRYKRRLKMISMVYFLESYYAKAQNYLKPLSPQSQKHFLKPEYLYMKTENSIVRRPQKTFSSQTAWRPKIPQNLVRRPKNIFSSPGWHIIWMDLSLYKIWVGFWCNYVYWCSLTSKAQMSFAVHKYVYNLHHLCKNIV